MPQKIYQLVPEIYPRLTQYINGQLYDGNGNPIPIQQSSPLTYNADNTSYIFTTNIEFQGTALARYTSDPTLNQEWGDLSIPSKKYVDNKFDSASITTETNYTNLKTLQTNNQLKENSYYIIKDKADTGIIVYAASTQSISSDARGGYYVPNYQNQVNKGTWTASSEYFLFSHTNYYIVRFYTQTTLTGLHPGDNLSIFSFTNVFVIAGIITGIGDGYLDITPAENTSENWINVFDNNNTFIFHSQITISPVLIQSIVTNDSSISTMFLNESVLVYGQNNDYLATGVLASYNNHTLSIKNTNANINDAKYIEGVSSNVTAFLTFISGPANNDVYFFNGQNQYKLFNINQLNGTNPTINTSAYVLLGTSSYILEWDRIIYDFENDEVLYRMDKRNNLVNNSSFNTFQFGNNNVHDFKINSSSSIVNILNNTGIITGNISGTNSNVSLFNNTGSITLNVNGNSNTININYNSGIIDIDVKNSTISANYNSGQLIGKYSNNVNINHDYNKGNIIGSNFDLGFKSTISLTSSYYHNYCNYTYNNSNSYEFIFPSNSSFINKSITNEYSTFDKTILLTDSTLTLCGNTNSNWAGIIYVNSNNSNNIISSIIGFNNIPISLYLSTGATFGFTTNVNTTNINSNYQLIMRTNNFYINTKADFITFKKTSIPFNNYYPLVQIDGINY